jgi:hypothetical protein
MRPQHRSHRAFAALVVGVVFLAAFAFPRSASSAPLDRATRRQSILYPGPITGPEPDNIMVGDFDGEAQESRLAMWRRSVPDTPFNSTSPISVNETEAPSAASTTSWVTNTSPGLA